MAKMSRQPKGNNVNAIVITFASVIGGLTGILAVDYLFKQKGVTDMTIEQQLVMAAKKLSEGVPRQIDRDTRLDSIVAGPGAKFNYNYTLINLAKSEVDVENLKSLVRQQLITMYKNSPEMKDFRQNNVLLVYKYSDKSGVSLFEISVSPSDF